MAYYSAGALWLSPPPEIIIYFKSENVWATSNCIGIGMGASKITG